MAIMQLPPKATAFLLALTDNKYVMLTFLNQHPAAALGHRSWTWRRDPHLHADHAAGGWKADGRGSGCTSA